MRVYVTTGAPRPAAERARVSTAGLVRGARRALLAHALGADHPDRGLGLALGQIVRPHRWQRM